MPRSTAAASAGFYGRERAGSTAAASACILFKMAAIAEGTAAPGAASGAAPGGGGSGNNSQEQLTQVQAQEQDRVAGLQAANARLREEIGTWSQRANPGQDWQAFLRIVDVPSAPADQVEDAAKVFVDSGLPTPTSADGIVESDLQLAEVRLPVRGLLRRALRTLVDAAEAKRTAVKVNAQSASHREVGLAAGVQQPNYVHSAQVSSMLEAIGPDASAMAVANVMAHGGKDVDINAQLQGVNLGKISFTMQADNAIWQVLQAENEAAAKDAREAYAYVDLTSKGLVPIWLAPDAVGGSVSWGGESEWSLDPRATSATLGQLGQALKKATCQPRFFRSLAQWAAAYNRYAMAAVAMKQLTWAQAFSHMDVVLRMAEESRSANVSPFLAILYDDMLRQSVSQRVNRKDPTLDFDEVFTAKVPEIKGAAEQRLAQVLQAAGLHSSSRAQQADFSSAVADGAVAKQAAAAEALQRRAEAAARQLAAQQEELNRRQSAMRTGGKGGNGSGGGADKAGSAQGGGPSNKRRKTEKWAEKYFHTKKDSWNSYSSGAGRGSGGKR